MGLSERQNYSNVDTFMINKDEHLINMYILNIFKHFWKCQDSQDFTYKTNAGVVSNPCYFQFTSVKNHVF